MSPKKKKADVTKRQFSSKNHYRYLHSFQEVTMDLKSVRYKISRVIHDFTIILLELSSHELLPKIGQLCNLLHSDRSKLPIAENCTFGLNWPSCPISCHMKVRSWKVRLCTSIFLKQIVRVWDIQDLSFQFQQFFF